MPRLTPKPPIIRGVPRDCDCTRHAPHGTRHTYEYHSCGCDACRDAATRYQKAGRLLHARGLQRRRSAEPVRRRVERLKERGLTVQDIADQAGVSIVNLYLILRGDRDTVTARTATRILAVPVPPRSAAA